MNVGIFGGTFNPVHFGHLRAAEEVREKLRLDRILFVPSGKPPLKTKEIAPAKHRYEMLRLALRGNPFFSLSDIECRKRGKAFTVETLEALQDRHPGRRFFFILGIDAFLDIPRWWRPEQLVSMTDFIVISRPGFSFSMIRESPFFASGVRLLRDVDQARDITNVIKLSSNRHAVLLRLTPIGISSTRIRKYLMHGRSIKYLLPHEVQSYIITHKLYTKKNS
jgi:nicotinate-nucleotide adenylyltransferase